MNHTHNLWLPNFPAAMSPPQAAREEAKSIELRRWREGTCGREKRDAACKLNYLSPPQLPTSPACLFVCSAHLLSQTWEMS